MCVHVRVSEHARAHTHKERVKRVRVCARARVCVRPSLKAFKREWERVWNPGMTSLSMMSFLQGDFGTCDRLGEVTLSLLTRCN